MTDWEPLDGRPADVAAYRARLEAKGELRKSPISKRVLDRTKTVHNERTKLSAGAINATALALLGGGFVLPLVSLSFPLASAPPDGPITIIAMAVWALVAVALHWWARTILGDLR